MISTIEKDTQKYFETCRKNSENGKKSGEARKKAKSLTVANNHQPPLTTVSDNQPPLTNLTDNDNEYDNEYDNDNDSENESAREETKLSQKITSEMIKNIDSRHILNNNDIKYLCEYIKTNHVNDYVSYVIEYIQKK